MERSPDDNDYIPKIKAESSYDETNNIIEALYEERKYLIQQIYNIDDIMGADSYSLKVRDYSHNTVQVPSEYINKAFFQEKREELLDELKEIDHKIKKIEELVECLSE